MICSYLTISKQNRRLFRNENLISIAINLIIPFNASDVKRPLKTIRTNFYVSPELC